MKALEGYIKEMGYTAIRGAVNPQGAGLAAGLGELGRNGMMITERFGARVHMPDPILTDMPLFADEPDRHRRRGLLQDLPQVRQQLPDEQHHLRPEDRLQRHPEVQDQLADLLQDPPVRRRSLRQLPDLRRRLPVHQAGRLVAAGRRQDPQARPRSRPGRPIVRALKWIDDKFWGEFPSRRVTFMGYDTGLKVGEHACTDPECTANHEEPQKIIEGNVGLLRARSRSRPTTSSSGARRWHADLADCRACVTICHACAAPSRLRGGGRAPVTIRTGTTFINRPPADVRNMIPEIVGKAPEGNIFPTQSELHSPNVTARHVKELTRYLRGAARRDRRIWASRTPEIARGYPFAIVTRGPRRVRPVHLARPRRAGGGSGRAVRHLHTSPRGFGRWASARR